MKTLVVIEQMKHEDWLDAALLIARAIPNTVLSKLGAAFGAAFYRRIAEQDSTCMYAVRDGRGKIAGIIIGTIKASQAYREAVRGHKMRLLMAANFRLLHVAVLVWLLRAIVCRLSGKAGALPVRPESQLLVIAVCPEAQGTGISRVLVDRMELFFYERTGRLDYFILTEQSNLRANRFYEKIGAVLSGTVFHHARAINEWRKTVNKAGS